MCSTANLLLFERLLFSRQLSSLSVYNHRRPRVQGIVELSAFIVVVGVEYHSGRIRLLFPEILPPIVEHHGDEEGGRYTEDNERQKNDTRTRSGFAALLSLEFQQSLSAAELISMATAYGRVALVSSATVAAFARAAESVVTFGAQCMAELAGEARMTLAGTCDTMTACRRGAPTLALVDAVRTVEAVLTRNVAAVTLPASRAGALASARIALLEF